MKNEYELRDYQQRFVDASIEALDEVDRAIAVMATGGGKTICFAAIAECMIDAGKRVCIMAHTDELCAQASDKIHRATGHIAQVEKASQTAARHAQLVVTSVQTMSRRLDKWPPRHFDLLIIDEAHRSTAESYRKVIDHFGCKVLGVTATGFRSDDAKLFDVYEKLACEIGIRDLHKGGYLCGIKVQQLPVEVDLGNVDPDRNKTEAENILDRYLEAIAIVLPDYIGDRRTIAFLPFKRTAERFAALCRRAGISAQHVHGSVDSAERAQTINGHRSGKFQVLTNPHMLAEGYDDPQISCVLPLVPTRSRVRYIQQVGRGTRIADGKQDLLVLDPLYLSDRYSICSPADLTTSSESVSRAVKTRITREKPIDLFGAEDECIRERENALANELEQKRHRQSRLFDPLEIVSTFHASELMDYRPKFAWERKEATHAQIAALAKCGIDAETIQSRGHASALFTWLQRRREGSKATLKQLKCLARNGYQMSDIVEMSFGEASDTLNRILK